MHLIAVDLDLYLVDEIVEREKLRQEVEEEVRETVKAETAEAEAAKE